MTQAQHSRLRSRVVKLIRSRGGYARSIHGSSYMAGIPDVLACYKGIFVALEVKTGTARTTKLQDIGLLEIAAAGGEAAVIRGIDEVVGVLNSIDERVGHG